MRKIDSNSHLLIQRVWSLYVQFEQPVAAIAQRLGLTRWQVNWAIDEAKRQRRDAEQRGETA